MTWHADQTEGRPEGDAKAKLMADRSILIHRIEVMKASPLRTKSQAEAAGRIEDLTALAKKVTAIDRKLGRL